MSVSEPARCAGEPHRRAEHRWRRSPVMTVGTSELARAAKAKPRSAYLASPKATVGSDVGERAERDRVHGRASSVRLTRRASANASEDVAASRAERRVAETEGRQREACPAPVSWLRAAERATRRRGTRRPRRAKYAGWTKIERNERATERTSADWNEHGASGGIIPERLVRSASPWSTGERGVLPTNRIRSEGLRVRRRKKGVADDDERNRVFVRPGGSSSFSTSESDVAKRTSGARGASEAA